MQQAIGQSFKEQFARVTADNDTSGQRSVLMKWENEQPSDPDLYIAWFNYYFLISQGTVTISNKQEGATGKPIDDKSKNVVYKQNYSQDALSNAYSYIDKGIAKFPNRLDMRFGKIYVLGENEDYNGFSTEIVKTIDHAGRINNKWLWADNEPLDNVDKIFPETLQKYFVQLYTAYMSNRSNTAILDYMENICTAILKHQPDRVVALSNLALVHMFREDFDKAIPVLLKAEELAPTDAVIFMNLAQVYEQKGNREQAVKYYQLLAKHGAEREKAFALKQLEKLK